jgi:hypothetical protein
MFARWFWSVALLGLASIPAPVQAGADDAATTPTLVVRVRSLDGLLGDIQYVANLAGRGEEAKQLRALLESRAGPKGLDGLDTKRPFGLYGTLDTNLVESTAVVLIPISDQKAFLALLENFNFKAKKEADGIYAVTPENLPVPIYFRFANQYAYVTAREKTALDKSKLLDPTKVLAGSPNETVSAVFRIDQLPETIKQIATSQIEVALSNVEDQKRPGETEAERKLRLQAAKETSRQFTALINEGREFSLRLGIDRAANQLYAEGALSGKPNTELASSIAASAASSSFFGGLANPQSAAEFFLHGAMPAKARQQFVKTVDDMVRSALEKETDPNKRAVEEKLYTAILPTLKAGELDVAAELRGPKANQHYGAIAALRVKDGKQLQKVLHELRDQMPASERALVKLNVETIGSAAVDRLDIQQKMDEQAKKLLGENPIYLAFRDDALFVAGGDGGLSLLKDALNAQPATVAPFKINLSVARLAPVMAKQPKPDVRAIAQKAFGGTGKNNDTLQLVAEGGKTAKARIEIKADVIKFFSLLDKAKKAEE